MALTQTDDGVLVDEDGKPVCTVDGKPLPEEKPEPQPEPAKPKK